MTENNRDNEIEQLLQKFRPAGPPDSLRHRILSSAKAEGAGKSHWLRYATIAAAAIVLIVAGSFFLANKNLDNALDKKLDQDLNAKSEITPQPAQLSFAEIERKIARAGRAARLLAATDLLARHSSDRQIVKDQYSYIAETYPQTAAATKAKLQIESYPQ